MTGSSCSRPHDARRPRLLPVVLAILAAGTLALVAGPVAATEDDPAPAPAPAPEDAPKPFPDSWFFYGEKRPATLRAMEGTAAPELSVDAWIGDEVELDWDELRGRVVIVDFWATWCGPCRRAIPKNVEMVEQYRDEGLVFLGLHAADNGWAAAEDMVRDTKINYPVARDAERRSQRAWNVRFWPTYFAIDKHGRVRAAGLLPSRVDDVVKVLLAEEGPAPGPAPAAADDDGDDADAGPGTDGGGIDGPPPAARD